MAYFTKPAKSNALENNSVGVIFEEKPGKPKLFRKAIANKREKKKRLYTTSNEPSQEKLQSLKLDEKSAQGSGGPGRNG